MKLLGATIIICACWFIGLDFYKSNMKKLDFAKGLFDGVEFLKSEIAYTCEFLGESILKAAEFSGDAFVFMETVGKELKEKGVSTEAVFEKAESAFVKNFNKETYLLTKDLFMQLGEKDCENQVKMLEGYLKKLAIIINNQNDFCKKECVVLKKTGAIVGIGIAVLLI